MITSDALDFNRLLPINFKRNLEIWISIGALQVIHLSQNYSNSVSNETPFVFVAGAKLKRHCMTHFSVCRGRLKRFRMDLRIEPI